MKCQRCGNEDKDYFYLDHDVWYCRKCIAFGRIDVGDVPKKISYQKPKVKCDYQLKYPLTKKQQVAIREILLHLKQQHDVLVYAACGAGKTELVMEAIKQYLNAGKKVGFAISRRQVVLEIRERMQAAFPMLKVVAVCEGFTKDCDGDLIVCTMHQLYRYYQTFDLLIMDEVDAFPYRNNKLLETIAMRSCTGRKIMLTATPDEETLEKVEKKELWMVNLFQRPHGYPLIVPKVRTGTIFMQNIMLVRFLLKKKKEKQRVLVFVPTIAQAHRYHRWLSLLFACAVFSSKTKEKEKVIDAFHEGKYQFLISTTILERGITIKGIHIAIVQADHKVFTEASLIQMIGRVGRNIEMPTGEGVFYCTKENEAIKRCVEAIKKMNER